MIYIVTAYYFQKTLKLMRINISFNCSMAALPQTRREDILLLCGHTFIAYFTEVFMCILNSCILLP